MNERLAGPDGDNAIVVEILKYRLERQNAAQRYNSEMAKWILASLILVNGAPFLLASKNMPELTHVLMKDAWYFTVAVSLAIICGFCAWLNTGMREAVTGCQVERLIADGLPAAVGHAGASWEERISSAMANIAYGASVLTGFGSLALFLLGTLAMSHAYDVETKPSITETNSSIRL